MRGKEKAPKPVNEDPKKEPKPEPKPKKDEIYRHPPVTI
jgi:hypothetical protein